MKRFMIQIQRIFKSGSKGFLRNAWLSTAGTLVMTITLLVLVATFVANSVLNSAIVSVTNKIDVSVYLKDGISQDQLTNLMSDIEKQPNVKSVDYISKEEALNNFREQYKTNQTYLRAVNEVGERGFFAQLKVEAKDPTQLDSITSYLDNPNIKEMEAKSTSTSSKSRQTIDRIVQVARFLRVVGLVGGLVFAAISVMVIFNTIRMAIFNRKDEIEIMQLVGANKWYIRGPFLIEAAIYGLVAGVISLILSYIAVINEMPKLQNYTDVSNTVGFFQDKIIYIGFALCLFGILLGVLSSLLAMRRYLKLKSSK